jgi:hypothetical protein
LRRCSLDVRETYTAEEWETLRRLPLGAATLVVLSGRSGPLQLIREAGALAGSIREAARHANPLIAAIAADLRDSYDLRATDEDLVEEEITAQERLRRLRVDVFEYARVAREILAAKSPAGEAAEYRAWVLEVARRAAIAAKEGGFLGFGGTRVIEEEAATLDALATCLDVSR